LALPHGQRHSAQRLHVERAGAVLLGHLVELDDGWHGQPPVPRRVPPPPNPPPPKPPPPNPVRAPPLLVARGVFVIASSTCCPAVIPPVTCVYPAALTPTVTGTATALPALSSSTLGLPPLYLIAAVGT